MDVILADTVKDVPEKDWNALTGTDIPERAQGWYKTVEDSGMRDMHYVLIREDTFVAAACCHLYKEPQFGIRIPVLQVGSPTGTTCAFFSNTVQHTDALLSGLEELRMKENARGLVIIDFNEDEFSRAKPHLESTGFTPFFQLESMYIDLPFSDFDDYLSSLPASDRRSIRKTLNRAEKRWRITHVLTNDFLQWGHIASKLQRFTCEEHNNYRMHLTEDFYSALKTHFKESAELTLFFKEDIPLASGLCLNSPTLAFHKFSGVDPRYRQYQAYFLLYYEGIRKAIERRQKRIYFGSTTYEFKRKIGCKGEKFFGFAKMENPVLNTALKYYFKVSTFLKQR